MEVNKLGDGAYYCYKDNKTIISYLNDAFITVKNYELTEEEVKKILEFAWADIGDLMSTPFTDNFKNVIDRPKFSISVDCEDEFSPVKLYFSLGIGNNESEEKWSTKYSFYSFDSMKEVYTQFAEHYFKNLREYSRGVEFKEDFEKDFEYWKNNIDRIFSERVSMSIDKFMTNYPGLAEDLWYTTASWEDTVTTIRKLESKENLSESYSTSDVAINSTETEVEARKHSLISTILEENLSNEEFEELSNDWKAFCNNPQKYYSLPIIAMVKQWLNEYRSSKSMNLF